MNEYTFAEIKEMLLKCICEHNCEAELSLKFKDNTNEYMIIIYDDHCSFQRCGCIETASGEYRYKTLDELYVSQQVDNIILERDWNRIECIDCMDFDTYKIW